MRVAAYQFDVRRGDVAANVSSALEGLDLAHADAAELLLLPEMWATSFVSDGEDAAWLDATRSAWASVTSRADELGIAVAGSAYGPAPEGERLRNRFLLWDGGRELLVYDKVHLFSPTGETGAFSAGGAPPATVQWRGFRVSAAVCYDLRFPALLEAPFEAEAELLLVPAQWPRPRDGHWGALLQGRAVEHQAFVLGANRTGIDRVGRRALELDFPGNSLLVSPHGRVIAAGTGPAGLVAGELDLAELRELRRRLPVRKDQQKTAYGR